MRLVLNLIDKSKNDATFIPPKLEKLRELEKKGVIAREVFPKKDKYY